MPLLDPLGDPIVESIILDPDEVATGRTELDVSLWVAQEGIDWGDAAIEAYLAKLHMGALPVDFDVPPRTITIPLVLKTRDATTFTQIRERIQAKAALFQREGGWLKRITPSGHVFADITHATLKLSGGWLQAHREIDIEAQLVLEAIPDFYGDEIELDDIVETTAAEIATVLKLGGSTAVIKGEHPARCRIVVDNDSAQSQLGLIWAVRSRHYSAAATARLAYEAEALTPLDAAAIATLAGASGGASNNVVQHTNLSTLWTALLSTQIAGVGQMTHTGTYRVRARVLTPNDPSLAGDVPVQVRLVWDVGDMALPTENRPVRLPGSDNFHLVDLGEVRLDPPPVGTHRWQGVVQARGDVGGEDVAIDRLWFVPASEGYGLLQAVHTAEPGITGHSARDEFVHSAGGLTGKTAVVGGNWVGAGDADDFTVDVGAATVQRTAVSDADGDTGRYATLNVNIAATTVQADVKTSAASSSILAVLARYADVNNWLRAELHMIAPPGLVLLVRKRQAGTTTALAQVALDQAIGMAAELGAFFSLRLQVEASGRWFVWVWKPGGRPVLAATGADVALATGGALASGDVGINDANFTATAATRTYDNFAAWVPDVDAVLHPSQSAELRTDGTFRETADGAGWGPTQPLIGDMPRLPPSGLEGRPVELFLKATRGDDRFPDTGIDDISARVAYRPSHLLVPGI